MKVMILSDSHTMNKDTLIKLMQSQKADYYLHCGDIYMGYEGLALNHFYLAKGNNDFSNLPKFIVTNIDNLTFVITHGHLYDVDYSLEGLSYLAKDHQGDVVCFGHTHRPTLEIKDNVTFINPGSVTFPRGSYIHPTFCIFDTETKSTTFYDVKTLEPCNPFYKPQKQSIFKKLFNKH